MKDILRSALHHVLSRRSLLIVLGLSGVGMTAYLVQHRDDTLLELVSGPTLLVLAAAAVAAGVLLRLRSSVVNAADRRFFRHQHETNTILGELPARCGQAATLDELVSLVCHELGRALHTHAAVLLATADGRSLTSSDGRIRPISRSSGLALLAQGDTTSLVIDLDKKDSAIRRLSGEERSWLAESGIDLLVPLNASDGSLHGLICLGSKGRDLPYSPEDRRMLETIGASVVQSVENRRLRESGRPVEKAADPPLLPWFGADDGRPARECAACGRVYPPETNACDCGNSLEAALVPFVLAGKFQFDRRLGRGGMGVAYRARDMDLGRQVAVKTLPLVAPEDATRLRREARAMAAVHHENLAVIFGAETWLGTPMLIVELLTGGTLADRLTKGPIAWPRALEIGIALSKGVAHLHRAGVLHCDIKPSNIGFTREEVPKLLDFGLATILRDRIRSGTSTTRSDRLADRLVTTVGTGDSARAMFGGTPVYMSPEAIAGDPPRPAFDVWSLCVVLFETMTGTPPFDGATIPAVAAAVHRGHLPDIRTLSPTCPAALAAFFSRALSHRPDDRPATAVDLGEQLVRLRS